MLALCVQGMKPFGYDSQWKWKALKIGSEWRQLAPQLVCFEPSTVGDARALEYIYRRPERGDVLPPPFVDSQAISGCS